MKIQRLQLENFKGIRRLDLDLNGQSALILGENGTGKSAILEALCFLSWNWINRLNPVQSTGFKSLQENLIYQGADRMSIEADFLLGGHLFPLKKACSRKSPDHSVRIEANKKLTDRFLSGPGGYLECCQNEEQGLSLFVYYGANRFVHNISLEARSDFAFDKWAALERSIESRQDFRTFFEWFRNQEDYEAEVMREKQDLNFRDPALECVRHAVETLLPGFHDLQVKRSPLRMTIKKNGQEFSLDQLSDGEKYTLAWIGDLAHRLALANPQLENPLEGDGIVLIDELEQHLSPSWQRKILPTLEKTFPNIQFLITTQSSILPETAGEEDQVFLLEDKEGIIQAREIRQKDEFCSDSICSQFS